MSSARSPRLYLALAALGLSWGCRAAAPARAPGPVRGEPPGKTEVGVASFYAESLAGRPTASGEPYDPTAATCAHRTLRFGTVVQVTVLSSGAQATCRINDRGPFAKNRIIDLSRATRDALKLDPKGGVWKVKLEVLR